MWWSKVTNGHFVTSIWAQNGQSANPENCPRVYPQISVRANAAAAAVPAAAAAG